MDAAIEPPRMDSRRPSGRIARGKDSLCSFCPERIETQVAQGRATIFKGNKPLKMEESEIAFSDSVPETSHGWAFLDANYVSTIIL